MADEAKALIPLMWGERKSLPDRRAGFGQKASVDGHNVYLHTGQFENGRLGEIFISLSAREGATMRGVFNCFAMAVSFALQYGCPIEELVQAFKGAKFPPAGNVAGNANVGFADSIVDYIFQELEASYAARNAAG